MDAKTRIELSLERAMAQIETPKAPPKLAAAMRYAVFPGGARVRPKLCLAVASACGAEDSTAAAAAASIELLHCASLVHDDLPCFDDAATRRGKPSVHSAFGEPLAVLTGDALIVLAFEALAMSLASMPQRLPALLTTLSRSVGMPLGIVAGQGWESEPHADLVAYQRAKTGSLFVAATMAGAAAAGADPESWRLLGERIGEAYQIADDICDVAYSEAELGKPVGQDAALGRPNAAAQLGIGGAVSLLKNLVEQAGESIPVCPGADALRSLVMLETLMVLPKELLQRAA
ncbi:polyprenyl synthetase family protein [Methylocapsa palsarum]|uniref:Probable farnesyl diphosphate synthase n=1 Tax=Methylocapsa palsarum TaxID=1612308 RepID=A0A1I4BDC9_9HYPH|nr:polyprenyl synthetase family protein [Methylocapsa palsarum]SFK66290.1 geranylgeranyl diphosphate synthase, type II [Methylocapsa palsarum]